MTRAEEGVLLLCAQLGDTGAHPLTASQYKELSRRARARGIGGDDPLHDVGESDIRALGYNSEFAANALELLAREDLLRAYMTRAERRGICVIFRQDPEYPAELREKLGLNAPLFLFCKGDLTLFKTPCVALVGSRKLLRTGWDFARNIGILAAEEGYTMVTGGADGADSTAMEACLTAGGCAIDFTPLSLLELPARHDVLFCSMDGCDLSFTAARALNRNRLIHAMGEKAFVAQTSFGKGGSWRGSVENLERGYSPLFVSDDGSEGARGLIQRGGTPIGIVPSIRGLSPAQGSFL